MKRVLIAGLIHEVNSFVPGVAGLEAFRRRGRVTGMFEGDEVFGPLLTGGLHIDGLIELGRKEGFELIPSIAASAGAAPPVADSAYAYIKESVLAAARREQGKLDGVALALHGAMTSESLEDPEGDLTAAVREVVGPRIPLVVGFDMHCHMTELKLRPTDAIVGFHTHPHVDLVDTGERAMRILARAMRGEVRPVVAQRKIRMITSAETHNTIRGPMSEVMGRALQMETEPGILGATIFATQPWMDVTELGWSTVVVADGDLALAQQKADELALMCWERRERFLVHKTPVREAVQAALASDAKPWVLADSSDSISGGSYGDSTELLRVLLEMGYRDTALITITDAAAVAACFSAGVGTEITVPVGGTLTPQFFRPVSVTGRVKTLTDGDFISERALTPVSIGRTAVLQVGGIFLVLSEYKAETSDRSVYLGMGFDPRQYKIVQVKSPGGFRTVYQPISAGIFELEAPGPCDSDLTRLPFRRMRRPIWPFDADLDRPW